MTEERKRDLACGCVHARANECKRGWWIWAREAGWRPRHTTREATRAFPMPSTTPLSFLCLSLSFSFSLLPADLLRRSFAICARRAHLHFSVIPSSAEKQFSLCIRARCRLLSVSFPFLKTSPSFLIKRKIGNLWQY